MIVAPTAVYRLYDAKDRLVYVGVTDSPGARWGHHSRRDWWPTVVRYTLTWHERRLAALREEAQAIRTEKPLENIAGVDTDRAIASMTDEELAALPAWKPEPAQSRRPRGTGGLYPRDDGLWAAAVDLGYDSRGKRRRKVFTAKTADAALAKKAAWEAEQRASA